MKENLYNTIYNPDVLSCIANLSNDEVFTPPEVANAMLDMLPQELFSDPNAKFLDPACKSGVFLREIAKRLMVAQLPNHEQHSFEIEQKRQMGQPLSQADEAFIKRRQEVVDHIFHEQLYGIAITELTSLLSRRSLYCSKYPNSKYSVSAFDDVQGNIRFKNTLHRWVNGRCAFCGASEKEYGGKKREGMETHAYEFIHTIKPQEIMKMKFDVIIGNPPYMLQDGGHGASAIPIYQKFVEQAKKLNPRFLSMIVPSRWYAGGRGLDQFRNEMLHDNRIRLIYDYPNASDCFPGVEIKGGVCYFLWDRDNRGQCTVTTFSNNEEISTIRDLLEPGCETFIRYNQAISILHKVLEKKEKSFGSLVSANDPFGYDVRVENSYLRIKPDIKLEPFNNSVKIYYFGWKKNGIGYIDKKTVRKNPDLINACKIFISRAYGAGEIFPHQILGVPFVAPNGSVCTETYLMIGPFDNEETANNVLSYISTRFFRFLVMLKKNTQSATPAVYQFVPMQDFTKPWSDEELYAKYGLDEKEIAFIDSMIRPMDLNGGDDDA